MRLTEMVGTNTYKAGTNDLLTSCSKYTWYGSHMVYTWIKHAQLSRFPSDSIDAVISLGDTEGYLQSDVISESSNFRYKTIFYEKIH